jgi:hypothetical protein
MTRARRKKRGETLLVHGIASRSQANRVKSMSGPSQISNPSALAQLTQMIVGFRSTQAIYVAAKLGIADQVADIPMSADELPVGSKN